MRLIDAERLRALISTMYEPFPDICNVNVVLTAIDIAPTIEAEPVRHAHAIYIPNSKGYPSCSCCHEEMPFFLNFCPCCGARMDADHIADDNKKVGGAQWLI